MDDELRSLIATAATPAGSGEMLGRLTGRCWPSASDGTVPLALPWVQRWHARTSVAYAAGCSCAMGRCGVCN